VALNLVTGADGFVGQHLVAELLRRGEEVVGAVRQLPPQLTTLPASAARQARWAELELERRETVRALVSGVLADRVYHLAGLASVGESLADAEAPMRVNVIGTLRLLEELARVRRQGGRDPRILIAGSGQVYGAAANRYRPLREDHPLEPLSPYAVSKAAQEMLGLQFQRAEGLAVVVTRSFNHTGPGQRLPFVAAELAAKVRAVQAGGGRGVVSLANPEIRRDFTDVRDVVRAYVALAERGEAGQVYNVCSGRSVAVREILATLVELTGVEVRVETDATRARPADLPELVGSFARLAGATGWAPQVELRRSLAGLLGLE
jgi:GDP-4-dehydro-6-deoxy-D-mannose reductase